LGLISFSTVDPAQMSNDLVSVKLFFYSIRLSY
jgi:hypothetical protein